MKILFYSLNAAIWPHALPENRLVKELVQAGHDVTYVTCGSSFKSHCASRLAHGISLAADQKEKDRVCLTCNRNAAILAQSNRARSLRLSDHITPEDIEKAASLTAQVDRASYSKFEWMGVQVGKLASYELLLTFKKMSEALNDHEWSYWQAYIENSLLSLSGFARIYDEIKPQMVFMYSPQYGMNGVCASYAENQGSRVFFIEGSASNSERYEALRIWDWSTHGLVNPALSYWRLASRLSSSEIKRVGSHFRELLRGKSFAVYSQPLSGRRLSLREFFGIAPETKVILLTLSSFDEAYAAWWIGRFPDSKVRSDVFNDQFDWVRQTIAAMSSRDDVVLVIRVHPRDFPNKREAVQSEQAQIWMDMFASAPANVRINWPSDQISLYDVLREVDVVVTGWSATGVEALALGIPVVTYDQNLPSYPADVHLTGRSSAKYFANIDRALAGGRGARRAADAFRWLGLSFSRGVIRITPPVQWEKWLRVLIHRGLRRRVYSMLEGLLKRIDAARPFGMATEATRFRNLVSQQRKNLFELDPVESVGNAEGGRAAAAAQSEAVRYMTAIGLAPLREPSNG